MFSVYNGKRVFLTGHTGFKGGWLALWLKSLGAEVMGYALEPDTKPSFFDVLGLGDRVRSTIGDILDVKTLGKTMTEFKPEFVFHLAAQPLVRRSYAEPVLTYQTNVIGTLNVLEAARRCDSVKVFVNVTTDKCYENKEVECGYCEDDPMGGHDMYSSSKGCVEIMSSSYRRSFLQDGYLMATARAGNVIGGGDWAEDRLIPDCVQAVNAGETIKIRNPIAVRPWQHVLEPLSGYLMLGEMLVKGGKKFAQGFNFGPNADSVLRVQDMAKLVTEAYGRGGVVVEPGDGLHEAGLLMLNVEKAACELAWKPTYNAKQAVNKTVEWYKCYYDNQEMYEFTKAQIREFEADFGKFV